MATVGVDDSSPSRSTPSGGVRIKSTLIHHITRNDRKRRNARSHVLVLLAPSGEYD